MNIIQRVLVFLWFLTQMILGLFLVVALSDGPIPPEGVNTILGTEVFLALLFGVPCLIFSNRR